MIRWRDGADALHEGSLFGAFAALARGEAWSFPALRPHQREAWHAFTVQCAAMALIRAGVDTLPEDEASWRELLMALSDGVPEAWELVVDDWSKPALLQPPVVAAANRADYRNTLHTPDALDMLATAKNNDVKAERIAAASEEDWLFALVTLQTSEGYGGKDNHGISRMNGGLSSRMMLGVRPAGGATAAFRRDSETLLLHTRQRNERRGGRALLWSEPWNGTESLAFVALDELYVEVCRRVRFARNDGRIVALSATSKVPRVAAKALGGNTLDPWAPTVIDTKKDRQTYGQKISVTPSSEGFGYRQTANLLDKQKTFEPLLARVMPQDQREGLTIVAVALVRGQGKTEGLHRRRIRTSRIEEIEETDKQTALDRIGDIARVRADEASDAGRKLRLALISLVQGGPDQVRPDDDAAKKKVESWVKQFDLAIDREFFEGPFWNEAADDPEDHRRLWREWLRDRAREAFYDAAEAAPRTDMRRVRAIARAESLLEGVMRKWIEEVA